mgnify:CR=1 FL=1
MSIEIRNVSKQFGDFQALRDAGRVERDLAAHRVGQRLGARLVRDLLHLDARHRLEHLHREMAAAAVAVADRALTRS